MRLYVSLNIIDLGSHLELSQVISWHKPYIHLYVVLMNKTEDVDHYFWVWPP